MSGAFLLCLVASCDAGYSGWYSGLIWFDGFRAQKGSVSCFFGGPLGGLSINLSIS